MAPVLLVLGGALAVLGTARIAADLALVTRTDKPLPNPLPPRLLAAALRLAALARQLQAAGATVTSGYRSPAVNAAVRGDARSLHLEALALDFTTSNPAATRRVLDAWRARGDVVRAFEHDAGSGNHWHVELAP